jgi:hypothetical protein
MKKAATIAEILICLLFVVFAIAWLLFQYLPNNISSTSSLAKLNGALLQEHLHDPLAVAEVLYPSSGKEHLHHSMPRYQLSIRYETRPHPAVKPLDHWERASKSMAAKFRYFKLLF